MKEPIRIKHELFTGKRKNQRVGPRLVNVWETSRVFPTMCRYRQKLLLYVVVRQPFKLSMNCIVYHTHVAEKNLKCFELMEIKPVLSRKSFRQQTRYWSKRCRCYIYPADCN